jgi:mycofactocin system glycosyltransferase
VNGLTRDVANGPTALATAPRREDTPLPSGFTLSVDPSTATFDRDAVLMGGTPLRLWRLSARARSTVARWQAGERVGDGRAAGLLARRLASSGAFAPHPGVPAIADDQVTVVIPVRNRPAQLARLLGALDGLRCVVVDDASSDPGRCRRVCDQYGACFVGLPARVGPAGARNAGLGAATTTLVAFVDSDCLPRPEWLAPLMGYFDDPLVAAVAPRVIPASVVPSTVVSRYEVSRSSLDRGAVGGLVRPQSRIPYVPSAALIVRRSVAGARLFDPRLRVGEDVDLVWRMAAAGWDVHYVPESIVAHDGPVTAGEFLRRRASYGTSAALLSERHPTVMAPLQTSAWSAATWALALGRRPVLAVVVLLSSVTVLARRLRGLVSDPFGASWRIAGGGTVRGAVPALSGLSRAWSPALLVALLVRRLRSVAAAVLLVPALHDWWRARHDLDAARFTALHVADDLAYGTGVWLGCVRARAMRPLIPSIVFRARVWSSGSLRAHLGQTEAGNVGDRPNPEGASRGA